MLCWRCGRSVGSALSGRARWRRVLGVKGNVPLCRECAEAGEALATVDGRLFSAGGRSWVRCPNPVCGGVVWVTKDHRGFEVLRGSLWVRGVCNHCGTRVCGEPGNWGRPSRPDGDTKRREAEMGQAYSAPGYYVEPTLTELRSAWDVASEGFARAAAEARPPKEPPRRWVPHNLKNWLIFEWDGEQMWWAPGAGEGNLDRLREPNPAWASPAGLREAIRTQWPGASYREEEYQP